MESLRILGLISEIYNQNFLTIENCSVIKKTKNATRYYIYAENIDNGALYQLLLDEDHDSEIGNSFAIVKRTIINTIPKLSHIPKVNTVIRININNNFFHCDLFTFSVNGGVRYYSRGYIKVFMDKFQEITSSLNFKLH